LADNIKQGLFELPKIVAAPAYTAQRLERWCSGARGFYEQV